MPLWVECLIFNSPRHCVSAGQETRERPRSPPLYSRLFLPLRLHRRTFPANVNERPCLIPSLPFSCLSQMYQACRTGIGSDTGYSQSASAYLHGQFIVLTICICISRSFVFYVCSQLVCLLYVLKCFSVCVNSRAKVS